MLFGILAALCGGALVIHQTLRLARANPAERLPWIGYPTHKPTGVVVLTGAGGALIGGGATHASFSFHPIIIPALFLLLAGPAFLISWQHNRQVGVGGASE
ncbi:hypothetical protein [Nesterenkonia xinjiangensis]|uniref:Uncharacterized protein n=1 Tax=Nesterenkonia xinjiangensis TaxID=225327 RepID=A0A7Z0GNH8_9MICC|nr:hypothetical protein [Nesterenkonia xinjiangensis]NYJ78148.1 hypothetical protein [Nesterenkonia xinjiangensis]